VSWYGVWLNGDPRRERQGERDMHNIFYIIGLVVVVLFVLGYFGLR
jgi:predicted nucleic acid-binding Zn ribbon protein